jgi:hypothetical protein
MCNTLQMTMLGQYRRGEVFYFSLALIASGADRELVKSVQSLKEENRILRDRLETRVPKKPAGQMRLVQYGKAPADGKSFRDGGTYSSCLNAVANRPNARDVRAIC